MAKVRYVGPPGQSSTEISQELNPDGAALELVPGKTYELSGELAQKLLASDAKFQRPKPAAAKKTAGKKTAGKKSSSSKSAEATSSALASADASGSEEES